MAFISRTPFVLLSGAYLALALLASCGPSGTEATTCSSNGDCFTNYACDLAQTHQCLMACTVQTDCLDSETCSIPNGQTQGVCRFTDTDPGNPNT